SEQDFNALRLELGSQQQPFTVLHLGDVVANQGLSETPTQQEQEKLSKWLDLLKSAGNNFYFVPGDKDWANSGEGGLKAVKQLEKYLEGQTGRKNVVLQQKGCPGPEIIDLGHNLRIIAINSQWWMHPNQKPEEPETACGVLSRQEFVEELNDAIDDAGNRNILIVGHHPVMSYGIYGGEMSLKKHLFPLSDHNPNNRVPLPVLGTIYTAYRQNVGTPRDMANFRYQQFINDMTLVLQQHESVVYASGHEYSLQLLKSAENNYHLISGSVAAKEHVEKGKETLFRASKKGFSKLEYYADGRVVVKFYTFDTGGIKEAYAATAFRSACSGQDEKGVPVNTQFVPCLEVPSGEVAVYPSGTATMAAGPQYKANGFERYFLGDLYRDTWINPVEIEYLRLDTVYGGLTPVGTGGGRQTKSLRLKGANGRRYVFRSVNKDPEKALPPELRNTFIEEIVQDMTATGHPYGAMVVSSLLDSTKLLHAQPRLYVLPDHPDLGIYRKEFAGMMGILEENPDDPKPNVEGFGGAEDVKRTFNVLRQTYKDNDYQFDDRAYAKARAFDIWIGDWGRHEDNWKWAGYKQNNGDYVYEPIPRDRDHAFSRWNGLFPTLATKRWAIPGVANFSYDIKDIYSLSWPPRHLDRVVLTSLNREDWQQIARELQASMTDATIDAAVAEMPDAARSVSGEEIKQKLKNRRSQLPQALDAYYLLLSKQVDVIGSNKHEYFLVERQPEGTVRVRVYKKSKDEKVPKGEALFDRTFVRGETDEIRLYGFDGQDIFNITGETGSSIRVRVIGGEGQDEIRDESQVKSLRKQTIVYDNTSTTLTKSSETKVRLSDENGVNNYDRNAFEYDVVRVHPALFYNRSDGLGASVEVGREKQGFRKPDFKHYYGLQIRGSTNGLFTLTFNSTWRQLFGKWDGGFEAQYGNYFAYYDFFGLGNNTRKHDMLFDADFYRARYRGFNGGVFLNRRFLKQSHFRIAPLYERYNTDFARGSFLDVTETPIDVVEDRYQEFGSLKAEIDLDLRDKRLLTRRGVRIFASHTSYTRLNEDKDNFGLTEGFVEYAGTARIGIPVTLLVKGGGGKNYGDDLPFYKYTSLGLQNNLRGYVRNRFTGDASLFLNTELRLHLGQVKSQFLPFYYGLIGFYDKGRVWYKGNSPTGWHDGYGGGFYLSPVSEKYTLSALLQHSEEENILIQVAAGFRIDQ
ncbi:MAG: hypothetical protein LPK19_03665, partial [Hymenobacteraceae bacterium]|nr:hypothetical protein [Hymenobacteraceae bacterium]MDX5395295.1 hypothetical protein [Hymenobacteraceae bacterium]MDX5511331.1 hypothetical protein [Hymenobacteraceae bacterium]